jgi:phospholipase D1/2
MSNGQTDGAGEHGVKDKIKHGFSLSGLREKLKDTHLYDAKIKATHMKNKLGKFKNIVNTNHRHDEEHEQKTDAKRERVCGNHRFNSFAPERDGNLIKWYVDGRDYFWVSDFPLLSLALWLRSTAGRFCSIGKCERDHLH